MMVRSSVMDQMELMSISCVIVARERPKIILFFALRSTDGSVVGRCDDEHFQPPHFLLAVGQCEHNFPVNEWSIRLAVGVTVQGVRGAGASAAFFCSLRASPFRKKV